MNEEHEAIAAKGPEHRQMVRTYYELKKLEQVFRDRKDEVGALQVQKHRVALWMLGNRLDDDGT